MYVLIELISTAWDALKAIARMDFKKGPTACEINGEEPIDSSKLADDIAKKVGKKVSNVMNHINNENNAGPIPGDPNA